MATPSITPALVFEACRRHRLVAVIRAAETRAALEAARAVIRGGIALVEITYSVPDAPAVMKQLVAEAPAGREAGVAAAGVRARRAPGHPRAGELRGVLHARRGPRGGG